MKHGSSMTRKATPLLRLLRFLPKMPWNTGRLLAELNGDDQDSKAGSKDRILIIALGATVVVLAALVLILQVGIINKNKKEIKKNKKIEEEIDITDEKPYEDMDIEEQQQSDHETEDDYTDTEREDQ